MSHLRREMGMFVALLIICTGLYVSNHVFLGQDNISDTSRQIAMLGTFAVGLAFVIITGGIDLSVGSLIGLTGVLIAKFTAFSSTNPDCYGMPLALGIVLAVLIVTGVGLIQGLLITVLDLQPFIVTLGGMLLIRGVSQTIVDGGNISLSESAITVVARGGLFTYNDAPLIGFPVLIFLIVALLAAYLLHFTVFGRYVYAIGGNRDAAKYSGINVKRVETLTYVISAFTAAIAGICYAAYIKQMSQSVGISYELYAIAAAVLGGCSLRGGEGTILGVLIGSLVMRVIQNGINLFQIVRHVSIQTANGMVLATRTFKLNTNWENIIIGAVILIAVILDQLTHILQASRRRKKVTELPPQQPAIGTAVPA
jgi:ribose transport system permease protein